MTRTLFDAVSATRLRELIAAAQTDAGKPLDDLIDAVAEGLEPAAAPIAANPGGLTDAEMVVLLTTAAYKSFARIDNAIRETGISGALYRTAVENLNAVGRYLKRSGITDEGRALLKSLPESQWGARNALSSFNGRFAAADVAPAAPAVRAAPTEVDPATLRSMDTVFFTPNADGLARLMSSVEGTVFSVEKTSGGDFRVRIIPEGEAIGADARNVVVVVPRDGSIELTGRRMEDGRVADDSNTAPAELPVGYAVAPDRLRKLRDAVEGSKQRAPGDAVLAAKAFIDAASGGSAAIGYDALMRDLASPLVYGGLPAITADAFLAKLLRIGGARADGINDIKIPSAPRASAASAGGVDTRKWLKLIGEALEEVDAYDLNSLSALIFTLFGPCHVSDYLERSRKAARNALMAAQADAVATKYRQDTAEYEAEESKIQAEYQPFRVSDLPTLTAARLRMNILNVPKSLEGGGWTNGHMLDLKSVPKLIDDGAQKYAGMNAASLPAVPKAAVDRVVDSAMKSRMAVEPTAIRTYDENVAERGKPSKMAKAESVALVSEANATAIVVNAYYIAYFFKTYKTPKFFAGTGEADPVLVKFGGEVVGVIMPLRADGKVVAKYAMKAAAAPAPAALSEQEQAVATVDAAYRFEDATDEFKAMLASSVNEADYSMFATAKEMDVAAKSFGATISWGVNSTLDGIDGEPEDPNLTASMNREVDATEGHVFAVAPEADEAMAVEDDADQITLFDMATDGTEWVGVVRKDGAVVGRVDIAGDGKGMVYVGPSGSQRAEPESRYGDAAGRMVAALFATPAAVATPAPDLSHLRALQMRLSNEEARLAAAPPAQKAVRQQAVNAAKKEIAGEYKFLGIDPPADSAQSYDDDALLAELGADMPESRPAKSAEELALEKKMADAQKNGVLINAVRVNKTAPDNAAVMARLRHFIGKSQLSAMNAGMRGEEREFFEKKSLELFARVGSMPRVYQQDGMGDEAIAYLHYFRGGSDWYITERDTSDDQQQAFGFAILNGDAENAELGYISIEELIRLNVELDFHFEPRTLGKVKESHGVRMRETTDESDAAGQENGGMTNADQPVDSARAEDLAFLNSITAGSADMMADDLAERMEAAYGRHPNDAEIEAALLAAADAYQEFIVNASSAALAKK